MLVLVLIWGEGADPVVVIGPDCAVEQPGRVEGVQPVLQVTVVPVGTVVRIPVVAFEVELSLVLVVKTGRGGSGIVSPVRFEEVATVLRKGVGVRIVPTVVGTEFSDDNSLLDEFSSGGSS